MTFICCSVSSLYRLTRFEASALKWHGIQYTCIWPVGVRSCSNDRATEPRWRTATSVVQIEVLTARWKTDRFILLVIATFLACRPISAFLTTFSVNRQHNMLGFWTFSVIRQHVGVLNDRSLQPIPRISENSGLSTHNQDRYYFFFLNFIDFCRDCFNCRQYE